MQHALGIAILGGNSQQYSAALQIGLFYIRERTDSCFYSRMYKSQGILQPPQLTGRGGVEVFMGGALSILAKRGGWALFKRFYTYPRKGLLAPLLLEFTVLFDLGELTANILELAMAIKAHHSEHIVM